MLERKTSTYHALMNQYADSKNLSARIRLHVDYATNPEIFSVWVFEQLVKAAPRKATVLEVGSGRGDLWHENDHAVPADWHVTLTDVSPGMVEDCRELIGKKLARRFDLATVNIMEMPYTADHFDVVIANHVLYHVEDLGKGLQEIRRVLKPGGTLFAMTNGKGHLNQLHDLQDRHGLEPPSDAAARLWDHHFSLENGREVLLSAFDSVDYIPFEDTLRVTSTDAVVDYITSLFVEATPDAAGLQALRTELDATIARDGAFVIDKATGLFIAR
jgi:ubiquinone/menaquinone biosynthesis C-methylase UbiE